MNFNYPKPTESIEAAKTDLKKWGYCLLKNAIPPDLNKSAMERLIEQAKAEKVLNKAIKLNPKFATSYFNLSNVFRDLGKLQESEKALLKAIDLNPQFAKAYYSLSIFRASEETKIVYEKLFSFCNLLIFLFCKNLSLFVNISSLSLLNSMSIIISSLS